MSRPDQMELNLAIKKLNNHPDLTAVLAGSIISLWVYGRPAGFLTETDLKNLSSSTGWGKNMKRGANAAFHALVD